MTKLKAENLLRIAEYGDNLGGSQNHKVFEDCLPSPGGRNNLCAQEFCNLCWS